LSASLGHGVDWLGAALVTASLMSAIYAIVEAASHGGGSGRVLGFLGLAAPLMAAFVAPQARIENPIMPLPPLQSPGGGRRPPLAAESRLTLSSTVRTRKSGSIRVRAA